MDTMKATAKRANYKDILDIPLAPVARKIATAMLTAHEVETVIEEAGAHETTVYKAHQNNAVTGPTAHALASKSKIMDKLIAFCHDIIDKDAETPLKYSDKIAAAKLLADVTAITSDKIGDTYNVGIFDLRSATEEQLVKELARIENSRRNIIDVTPKETPTE